MSRSDGEAGFLIVNASRFPDGERVDIRVRGEQVVEVAVGLEPVPGEVRIDALGGALLPGLHDHHLHLMALSAARASVECGPPSVTNPAELRHALRAEPGSGWLRGIGYHESVAGSLDRWALDAYLPDRPVRIQHATGKLWMLNSAAIEALGNAFDEQNEGLERDALGRPTGRLFRLDDWLRTQLGDSGLPDPYSVSLDLARRGVTGITDPSPRNDQGVARQMAAWIRGGRLLQRIRLMGDESLVGPAPHPQIVLGERKILLDEDDLPDFEMLVALIRSTHATGRAVACHCVTRIELLYALEALREAGVSGDRIEHASVAPDELLPVLAGLDLTVVTQPGFVFERGDRYLAEAEADERPYLYRLQSLLTHGIPLGLSSDAPYGDPDPWQSLRAAVSRQTRSGAVLDVRECLTPEQALGGYLADSAAPGGPPRPISAGFPADLCLLDRPWRAAREILDASLVRLTAIAGQRVYQAG